MGKRAVKWDLVKANRIVKGDVVRDRELEPFTVQGVRRNPTTLLVRLFDVDGTIRLEVDALSDVEVWPARLLGAYGG